MIKIVYKGNSDTLVSIAACSSGIIIIATFILSCSLHSEKYAYIGWLSLAASIILILILLGLFAIESFSVYNGSHAVRAFRGYLEELSQSLDPLSKLALKLETDRLVEISREIEDVTEQIRKLEESIRVSIAIS